MTGFKEGAASSGLGDEDDPEDDELSSDLDLDTANADSASASNSAGTETVSGGLPWIYRRSGITDGRAKTVQLHLQQTTIDTEHAMKSDLEELLGQTVKKADLREAAYLVGLERREQVAAKLREWGYDAE